MVSVSKQYSSSAASFSASCFASKGVSTRVYDTFSFEKLFSGTVCITISCAGWLNKSSCNCGWATFTVLFSGVGSAKALLPIILCFSVKNSKSSKTLAKASKSGVSNFISSRVTSTGTSVFMVASLYDIRNCSMLFSNDSFCLPFSCEIFLIIFSMSPYFAIRLAAVFWPTPGTPGILSMLSPHNASMSITFFGLSMPNFSFTSFTPSTSGTFPEWGGLYMKIFSSTSWP